MSDSVRPHRRQPTRLLHPWDFPGKSTGVGCHCLLQQCGRPGFNSWVGNIPWRREWLPTPVFLPGEFNGQRSLANYSPWGHKESDMTEVTLHTQTHTHRKYIWYNFYIVYITPVLLPGKSHGRRSLVGYSPWGHKESDTTE